MNRVMAADELEKLRRFTTPTISNALKRLKIGRIDEGYTDASIRCIFPDLGAIVGYAVTLTIRSAKPLKSPLFPSRKPYWDQIAKYPAPRIVVSQDLDQPPKGAYFGEVNSNIHRALGCVGLITDGAVRDLNEVRSLGFAMFASAASVSHAFAHLEDFDKPVRVGGMSVKPGDLIHADLHGACVIPSEAVAHILDACRQVEEYEHPMIDLCKSATFSTEALADLMKNEGV